MDEQRWLNATVLSELIHYIGPTTSERKLRLLGCACCRQLQDNLPYGCAESITLVEQFADGDISEQALAVHFATLAQTRNEPSSVRGAARLTVYSLRDVRLAGVIQTCLNAAGVRALAACKLQFGKSYHQGQHLVRFGNLVAREQVMQCELLRDIFGNPFRPVAFSPSWRTDTVLALARTMYESRDFGAMPILADALQDAGCDNDDILDHCRDAAQVHVRGCWVCDLVLGKT